MTNDKMHDFHDHCRAMIKELDETIRQIEAGEDWANPIEFYQGQRRGYTQALCMFWQIAQR